eukprot:3594391-Rhodomonas_salina.1
MQDQLPQSRRGTLRAAQRQAQLVYCAHVTAFLCAGSRDLYGGHVTYACKKSHVTSDCMDHVRSVRGWRGGEGVG